MRTHALGLLIAATAATVSPAVAGGDDGDPPTGPLIASGLAFAVPTYAIGVIAHEGSHALAAKLLGAEVLQFSIVPGRYGPQKNFFFGYVRVAGLSGTAEKTVFWLAPKLTDLVVLGGYAGLALTDSLPDNRYAALALTTLALGFWVDFSKDIIATRRANDMVKLYNANGADTELKKLPLRLTHAAIAIAAGIPLVVGFRHVFENRGPGEDTILSVWGTRF